MKDFNSILLVLPILTVLMFDLGLILVACCPGDCHRGQPLRLQQRRHRLPRHSLRPSDERRPVDLCGNNRPEEESGSLGPNIFGIW